IPGVDGTLHGTRRRARFFSRNVDVPLMLLCVGPSDRVGEAIPDLAASFDDPVMTLERVRLCKREGETLAPPDHLPEHDDAGLPTASASAPGGPPSSRATPTSPASARQSGLPVIRS